MSEITRTVPRTVAVELVAAFTKDGAGGNPAGVVVDAEAITHDERQRIATAVGVSETAFVRRASDDVFEVEFYTPAAQVGDCGHATVATFSLLAQRGLLRSADVTKRTIIGDRAIMVEGTRVFMEQPRPSIEPFPHAGELASALGLAGDANLAEPVLADNGMRFVLIETTRAALGGAVPDFAAIEALTTQAEAVGLYVYALAGDGAPASDGAAAGDAAAFDATARMFAPGFGIPEESATGMGAGLLGGYLARAAERAEYRFLQGALMPVPSPSELIVRVEPRCIVVGGSANVMRTLHV